MASATRYIRRLGNHLASHGYTSQLLLNLTEPSINHIMRPLLHDLILSFTSPVFNNNPIDLWARVAQDQYTAHRVGGGVPQGLTKIYGAHFHVSINACTKLGPYLGSHNWSNIYTYLYNHCGPPSDSVRQLGKSSKQTV
jgi:hypothetical protein